MDMARFYRSVKNRLERYLMHRQDITSNSASGTKEVYVNNAGNFGFQSLINDYPYIILMDNNTTGEVTEDGFEGAEIVKVKNINESEGIIYLQDNLENDWTVDNETYVTRCPAQMPIRQVIIGDLSVINIFPTVCIVPTTESIEWAFLHGSKETISIDFIIYVERGDTEFGTLSLMDLTAVIKWILMSNLKIRSDDKNPFSVLSHSKINTIDYGTISKGSEFVKASKISWEGEYYVDRKYLFDQEPYDPE